MPEAVDVLAPDGSEIRRLPSTERGSMVQCRLPAGQTTHAVRHRHVDEVWYCLSGAGELWRSSASVEEVVQLVPGVGVSIPHGVAFQFRTSGAEPLEIVITTMPPWPGADEAVPVDGPWPPSTG